MTGRRPHRGAIDGHVTGQVDGVDRAEHGGSGSSAGCRRAQCAAATRTAIGGTSSIRRADPLLRPDALGGGCAGVRWQASRSWASRSSRWWSSTRCSPSPSRPGRTAPPTCWWLCCRRASPCSATAPAARSRRRTWSSTTCWCSRAATGSLRMPRCSPPTGCCSTPRCSPERAPPHGPSVGDTIYGGTFLLEGDGLAVVTATGPSTRLADISQLADARDRHQTPLTRELHSVVRTVAAIALGVGGLFLGHLAAGRQPAPGRVRLRDRRHRRPGPRGAAAHGDALPGLGCGADGEASDPRPAARGGRDARVDDVHLHRQDRHPDP